MNSYIPEPLVIESVEQETAIDWTFTLLYEKPLKGGQFFQISIPGVGEAPISVSAFGGGRLRMTIRNVGRVTRRLFDLKPGDLVYARGPYGNGFDLTEMEGTDLVVIAGGTGLAPVRQVISHFMNHPPLVGSLTVVAGFKSPSDRLFLPTLEEWEARGNVIVTVDKGDETWTGRVGLVTEYIGTLKAVRSPHVFAVVVGPPMMMKFTTLELLKHGVPEGRIRVSFERNMSCGLGKCGHCKIDETYVCLEGPVFPYEKARHLID